MTRKKFFQSRSGLTLIEMIIVIGVISLALPVFFNLVFTLLRQQVKIQALNQVKKEGDSALTTIDTYLRNDATQLYSDAAHNNQQCDIVDSYDFDQDIYYTDTAGESGHIYTTGSAPKRIAYKTSRDGGAQHFLTSGKVDVSGFDITCDLTSTATTPLVSVSFTLDYFTTSNRPEDTTQLPYFLRVKLRNR